MRKRLVTLAAIALIILSASGVQAYVETFDSSNASWNYGYGTNFISPQLAATWVSSGGNPDGHISGVSENLYAVWTYVTASYGDMTGQSLTIDTKVTGTATGNAQFYVGRGGTYFIDGTPWAIGNDANWTAHIVALNASNFTAWTGVNDNIFTLAEVLQAPTDIGVFFGGGLASGNGTLSVDNFGAAPVPIPAAVWLLGSGLIGLVGIRRRFKK